METSPQPYRGMPPLRKRTNRKPCKSGVFVSDISLEQLLRLTHLPSHQAAKALGLGITVRRTLTSEHRPTTHTPRPWRCEMPRPGETGLKPHERVQLAYRPWATSHPGRYQRTPTPTTPPTPCTGVQAGVQEGRPGEVAVSQALLQGRGL
jgi:hypothetical protein